MGAACYGAYVRIGLAWTAAVLLAACASTPKPAPLTEAQVAKPAPTPALPAAEELPVLLVAGNPERDVFAVLERLEPGNPAIGFVRIGWRTLLGAQLGDGLAMALDARAPLVIGIGSGPAEQAPLVGVAALLPDHRAAVERGYELHDIGRGLAMMRPRLGMPESNPIGSRMQCALLARGGRDLIACSREPDWLPRYAEFVADQLLTTRRDAALRLEMRGKLLQSPEQALSADLSTQAARAGYLTTLELLAAMRDFEAELALEPGGFELTMDFSLRPVSDSLAALLVAPSPGPALPPAFEQLPADATMAFTSRGVHPDQMGEVADRFWTMMLASLSENSPDARWAELVSVARKVLMRGGPLVGAYGHDTAGALATLTEERARKRPSEARIRAALADYWVLGAEGDWARVQEAVGSLLDLEMRTQAERQAAGAAAGPKLTREKLRRRDQLPRDAILLKFARPAVGSSLAQARYLGLAAADGWVWLAVSSERALAIERLRGLLVGERKATQEKLVLLRPPGVREAVAFAFVTPAAVISMDLPRDGSAASIDHAQAQLQELADEPGAAAAPVTISYGHGEGDKGYRRARLRAFVPDAMVLSMPGAEVPLPGP